MSTENTDPRLGRLRVTQRTLVKGYAFSAARIQTDELVDPIGLGGSSVVFKAFQPLDTEREITVPRAMKFFVLRDDLVPSDADTTFFPAQDNFFEEIRNVSQLSHENLIQVVDAGTHEFVQNDGTPKRVPFLVTHLISGCTLRDIIEGKHNAEFAVTRLKSRPELAVDLITQIARGLAYLHDKQFLHCDIAPKNIFIEDAMGNSLRAIVGDVGMSRCLLGDADEKLFIAGTKAYSPQRVIDAFGTTVARSTFAPWFPLWDVFGFSKTAYELLDHVSSLISTPWLSPAAKKARAAHEQADKYRTPGAIANLIEYCLPIHRERGGVPELEPSAIGSRKRMMPIEGLAFTKRIDSLVRHPALLRLLGVPQLTVVRSTAPGGNHTRYEHALGVMENVRRMLSSLLDEPGFLGVLRKDSVETGLVAAVLYNATRFPFSNIVHDLNKRLPPGGEKIFKEFDRAGLFENIFGDSFRSSKGLTLHEKILRDFPAVDIEKLKRILTGNKPIDFFEHDEAVLHALLNSSLDARVIDFVRRDSLHLGVSSGDFFKLDDLLPHLTISTNFNGADAPQVTLRASGVVVAEQIILMRYWLYQRVYWNQPNRAYNAILRRALLDLQECDGFESELRDVALMVDEREMLNFLLSNAEQRHLTSTVALLQMVVGYEKVLYAEIYERNIRQCDNDPQMQDRPLIDMLVAPTMSYATMRKFEQRLGNWVATQAGLEAAIGAPLILLDVPFEPGNIKLGTDIFVALPPSHISHSEELRTLEKVSPVIAGVNTNFVTDLQRLRIFLRPDVRREVVSGTEVYSQLLEMLRA